MISWGHFFIWPFSLLCCKYVFIPAWYELIKQSSDFSVDGNKFLRYNVCKDFSLMGREPHATQVNLNAQLNRV